LAQPGYCLGQFVALYCRLLLHLMLPPPDPEQVKALAWWKVIQVNMPVYG